MDSKLRKADEDPADAEDCGSQASSLLETTLENAGDAVYLYNPQTRNCAFFGNAVESLIGYIPPDIIENEQDLRFSLLHPEDRASFMDVHRGLQNNTLTESKFSLEYRMLHKDGRYRRVADEFSIVRNNDGTVAAVIGILRDAGKSKQTDRQSLDVKLHRAEAKFFDIFENTAEGILIADSETMQFEYANPAIAEMLGYSRRELLDMKVFDIHPEEEMAFIRKAFNHLIDSKKIAPNGLLECLCIKKDGTRINVRIKGDRLAFEGNEYIFGFFSDITQQKQQENEIKHANERFKRLADATFEAIIIHKDGQILDVNQQCLDLCGYTLDEVKDGGVMMVTAPQCRKRVKDLILSKYEGVYETLGRKKDGTLFPVQVQARQSVLDGEEVRITAIRDLTEPKKLRQELAESEQKYKDLYRNAKVALFRTRISDGKLLDCSRATLDLFGYTEEEIKNDRFSVIDCYIDAKQRQRTIEALKKNKQIQGIESQFKRKDGTLIWLEIAAEIFPEKDYLEGVFVNITARKILTKAELRILKQILAGKSNKEIANHLGRSVRTVEDHRSHIMQKLEVDNIVDLTRKALEYGISPDGE